MLLKIEFEFTVPDSFAVFIKKSIRDRFFLTLDIPKANKINNVLNKKQIFNFDINFIDILLDSINNIKIKPIEDKYVLFIDENKLYKDTGVKLISLCNLLTFGNMEIEGYPILRDVFSHIQKYIKKYRDRYAMGGF